MELSGVGMATAFGAGLISFLSPCVLPLVPGYLSYISGKALDESSDGKPPAVETLHILATSLAFVLGFTSVFIAFGAGASLLGQFFAQYRYEANIVGGIIVILFGLFMTGAINPSLLQRELRFHGTLPGGRGTSSYLLGVAFAFGWTPCIGPILGAILTVSATSNLVSNGSALLMIYSLGLGVPFVLAALFTDQFLQHAKKVRQHGPLIHKLSGGVLILMGLAMVTGYLSRFSIWLLQTFPWLGELG